MHKQNAGLVIGIVLTISIPAARLPGGTVAYWEFDSFTDGMSPAAVGGPAMDLRTAGGGADFEPLNAPAVPVVPNSDRTPSFRGDPKSNPGCLRSPGNAVRNRYLTTSPGTNVLRLHQSTWTLEGWIRCRGDEPEGFGDVLVTTRDAPAWCGFTLLVNRALRSGGGRRLACYFAIKPGREGERASAVSLRTDDLLIPGRWYHVAVTWDSRRKGPAQARLFVDGFPVARAETPSFFDTERADHDAIHCLHVGARQGSERNSFSGAMDEFRVSDSVLDPVDMLLFPDRPGPVPRVCRVAHARDLRPDTPRASDVLMRALRMRPINARDPHNTMRAMDAFHVTGLVWAYIHDPAVIAEIRKSGRFFQGAVTNSLSTMRDLLGLPATADASETRAFIRRYGCLSLDGSPNEQPWKRHWTNPFSRCSGCCSNPEFEALYIRALRTYIDVGATMIQRDEGAGNAARPNYGGCFCKYCMRGFRAFLRKTQTPTQLDRLGIGNIDMFNYRDCLRAAGAPTGDAFSRWKGGRLKALFIEYQHVVSAEFMARTRRKLDKIAGVHVAMSCNNGVRIFDDIARQFDWFFGELDRRDATAANLYRIAVMAAGLNRVQIVTMPKKGGHSVYAHPHGWKRHTRRTLATAYAVGELCMVPWDVYMPNTLSEDRKRSTTPRYFGKPEDYADLFGFIRANAALLDGYEDAAAIGPGLFEARWGRRFPVIIEGARDVYAFVRAKPGDESAPVVIHVVDWRDLSTPFAVRLRTAAFFGPRPIEIRLCTPAPYDPAQHRSAESEAQHLRRVEAPSAVLLGPAQAKAYAPLSLAQSLNTTVDGPWTTVHLPALTPWGIVVVNLR